MPQGEDGEATGISRETRDALGVTQKHGVHFPPWPHREPAAGPSPLWKHSSIPCFFLNCIKAVAVQLLLYNSTAKVHYCSRSSDALINMSNLTCVTVSGNC